MPFHPFADEEAVARIGGLSVENRLDRVSLHGSLDLARDRAGLRRARRLRDLLAEVVAALEAQDNLPEEQAPPPPPGRTRNPFG